jgi:hypothetical protein
MTLSQDTNPMFDDQQATSPALSSTPYDENGKPIGYQWTGVITGAMVHGDQSVVKGSKTLQTESTALRDETSATDMNLYYGQERDFIGTPITTSVDEPDAAKSILNEAGLNWPVHTLDGLTGSWEYANKRVPRHVYRLVPGKMVTSAGLPTTDPEQADHERSGKKLFTVAVSDRWKPVQNDRLIEDIVTFAKESNTQIQRVGTLMDETKVFAVLDVGEDFVLRNDDRTTAKMIVSNTHCPGGLDFRLMALRQVCSNTLVNPVRLKTKKMTHVTNITSTQILAVMRAMRSEFEGFHVGAELTSQVPSTLSSLGTMANYQDKVFKVRAFALEKFGSKNTDGTPKAMAEQPVWLREMIKNDEHLLASIVAIAAVKKTSPSQFEHDTEFENLPQAYRDIMGLYQKETLASSFNTVWGAVNGVTGYVDHFSRTRNGLEGHYQSNWYGAKAGAKMEAFKTAQTVSAMVLA